MVETAMLDRDEVVKGMDQIRERRISTLWLEIFKADKKILLHKSLVLGINRVMVFRVDPENWLRNVQYLHKMLSP